MKCLVLGGGGFIGSNLCAGLVRAGHAVRVFEYPHVHSQCFPGLVSQVEWHEGDFINPADVEQAMAGCEVVFHLISTTLPKSSNDNPAYDIDSNLVSTVRMLQSALKHGVRRVIFLSSGGTVYGVPRETPIDEAHPTDPICSYGIVKLAIEKYLHLFHTLHGLDYRVVRLANPYGPGQRQVASQGAVAVFLYRALHDQLIEIWGNGSVTRDYVHIDDVVSALLNLMPYAGTERIFNVGSGVGLSLNDLVAEIGRVLGRDVRHAHLPSRQFDVPANVLAISRAQAHLDWQPRMSLSAGLVSTLAWLRGNRPS